MLTGPLIGCSGSTLLLQPEQGRFAASSDRLRVHRAGPVTETRPVVFLHIGATKTGTTYLQNLIVANKEHLAAAGYFFPGDTWVRQVRAVQDVIDGTRGDPRVATEAQGAWAALAREVLDHTGTASIISMEFLSFADARRAKRAVTSLRPAEEVGRAT